jgi:hypothetical protein
MFLYELNVKMYYKSDGATRHFRQVVRQYLNQQFENRGVTQNWPPRSPDLYSLEYYVWSFVKAMVYARKLNTTEELLQRILSTATCINNTVVLRKFASSLITRVRILSKQAKATLNKYNV